MHTLSQGRIKVWQFGQLPVAPDFWGPPKHRFHFCGSVFCSSTSKNFACGAKIPSKFFGCGANSINNFAFGAKILKNMAAAAVFF
jgi:hypothetical protein